MLYDEGVTIFVAGLAVPETQVPEMKRHGLTIMVMTGKVSHATRAEAAGADIVAAQGTEAGGHTGEIGTLALVPQVVDAVKIPVVAAGGIVDGRGVVAALALGAQGAIIGTRFIATPEATAAPGVSRSHRGRRSRTRRSARAATRASRSARSAIPYILEHEADPSKMKRFPEQLMISDPARRHGLLGPRRSGEDVHARRAGRRRLPRHQAGRRGLRRHRRRRRTRVLAAGVFAR